MADNATADLDKSDGSETPLAKPECFFVPPHLFIAMSEGGGLDEKEQGQGNAVLGQQANITENFGDDFWDKIVGQVEEDKISMSPTPGKPNRHIFDMQFTKEAWHMPGILARSEGQGIYDKNCVSSVDICYDNLGHVYNFFQDVFGRDSIDGKGMPLIGIVNYDFYFPGAWCQTLDGKKKSKYGLVFGNGHDYDPFSGNNAARPKFAGYFGNFVGSIEVIAHEIMHAITTFQTNLDGTGESGALHEHIADAFGSMAEQWRKEQTVEQADWLIGEDLLIPDKKGQALRSMAEPGKAYKINEDIVDKQTHHMDGYFTDKEDRGGVHINSGIPNRAFHIICMKLGGKSWEKAGQIWYAALKDAKVTSNCSFQIWASVTKTVAKKRFGVAVADIVNQAWVEVGILK